MLNFIDVIYLIFMFITLFFTILFFVLFAENKKEVRKIPKIKYKPFVSIIVPSYNEEKTIAKTIRNLKKLIYPKNKLEIIVVNDGSTDNTGKIARSFKGIKVFDKINEGKKAFALNYGIRRSKGSIIACVDADSFPEPNCLIKTIPFFNDPQVSAVTASIQVKNPKNLLEKLQLLEYAMIAWSRKLFEFLESVYVTPGPLSLYRRDVLVKLGLFDTTSVTEDIEIAWRMLRSGFKIRMSSPAIVYTSVPSSMRDWWKQRIRWNVGGFQTSLKYKDAIFRSRFNNFGIFVVPFFILFYIVSLLGFTVFVYLLGRGIYNYSSLFLGLYSTGTGMTSALKYANLTDFIMLPNSFTIFGFSIFLLSIVWTYISLRTSIRIKAKSDFYNILIYVTLYITLFPVLLIDSLFKFFKNKEHKW